MNCNITLTDDDTFIYEGQEYTIDSDNLKRDVASEFRIYKDEVEKENIIQYIQKNKYLWIKVHE